jgi:glutathione S-transferase
MRPNGLQVAVWANAAQTPPMWYNVAASRWCRAQLSISSRLLDEFSLADIAYAPGFANLLVAEFDLTPSTNIGAWVTRVLDRPAWRQSAST